MNCAIHTDLPAVAYCRTCGKALCATCKHDVRGVIYCEDCIATRLHDTMPAAAAIAPAGSTVVPGAAPVVIAPEAGPNPVVAALLGFIPGVGAMYNGQFIKGLVHVGITAALIWGADNAGSFEVFFGLGITFWWFYMVFDAYKTADARRRGLPLPDPFGFEKLWGSGASTSATGIPPAVAPGPGMPGTPGVVVVAPGEAPPHPPVGAIILIGLGVLFLLNTLNVLRWFWIGRFWPVILIVIGVWAWISRRPAAPPVE